MEGQEHKPSLATLDSSTLDCKEAAREAQHIQQPLRSEDEPSRYGTIRRHFRTFWWCYALGLVLILAVLLPCLFLLIIPDIIQHHIDKANLHVMAGTFEAVSPGQVRIGMTTRMNAPSSFTIRLDPFTMYIYNPEPPAQGGKSKTSPRAEDGGPPRHDDVPFLALAVGSQILHGTTNVTMETQTVPVQDQGALRTWLSRAFSENQSTVGVRGETTLHLGALHPRIRLDKVISFAGLNNLTGVNVTSTTPITPAEDDGTNLKGTLLLPNSSPFTLMLGNVTYDVLSGDMVIGQTSVRDLVMEPGNQTLEYRGQLDTDTILGSLEDVMASQAEAMKEGQVEFSVRGNVSSVHGEHIEYLDDILTKISLKTRLPVEVAMEGIMGSSSEGDNSTSKLI